MPTYPRRSPLTVGALVALVAVAAPALPADPSAHAPAAHSSSRQSVGAIQDALRDLWAGHVFWVRNVATATLDANTAAATAAEQQVVANARAIAAAIEPFYGTVAREQLFALLAAHYGAIKGYLDATMRSDAAVQQAAFEKLTANAGEIAVFLSGANPHLPEATVRGLLMAHGAHHVQQIKLLRAARYAEEAETWDAMKTHMYVIADALTGALAKQFPAKLG